GDLKYSRGRDSERDKKPDDVHRHEKRRFSENESRSQKWSNKNEYSNSRSSRNRVSSDSSEGPKGDTRLRESGNKSIENDDPSKSGHGGGIFRLEREPVDPHKQSHPHASHTHTSHQRDPPPPSRGRGQYSSRGRGSHRKLYDPSKPHDHKVSNQLRFKDDYEEDYEQQGRITGGYDQGGYDQGYGHGGYYQQGLYCDSSIYTDDTYTRDPYYHSYNASTEEAGSGKEEEARKLLHDALPLETQLSSLIARRLPSNITLDALLKLRLEVERRLELVILQDLDYSCKHNVDQLLWKSAYYQVIELMRKQVAEHNEDMVKKHLVKLLEEGCFFYESLLRKLESCYKFDLNVFISELQRHPDNLRRSVKLAILCCQRVMICLGDLARYKEQVHNGVNYGRARSWYLKAQYIAPKNGRPYNQLAILALYTRRKLDAVYYYMRSLAASNPFLTARESLMALFDEARKKAEVQERKRRAVETPTLEIEQGEQSDRIEIWVSPDGSSVTETVQQEDALSNLSTNELNRRFTLSFLLVHGKLFTKIGMEDFDEMCGKMLQEFEALLSRTPHEVLSNQRLLQLIAINMFAIENSAIKDDRVLETECRSVIEEQATQLGLDMLGMLVARCSELLKSHLASHHFPKDLVSPDLRELLPAVKAWCDWMSCHMPAWNPPPVQRPPGVGPEIDVWETLANFINLLRSVDISVIDMFEEHNLPSGGIPILLSEEAGLAGFVPLLAHMPRQLFTLPDADNVLACDCARIALLRYFGEYLNGIEPPMFGYNVEKKLYYSVAPKLKDERVSKESSQAKLDQSLEDNDMEDLVTQDESHGEGDIGELRKQKELLEKKVKQQQEHQLNINAILESSRDHRIQITIRPVFLVPDTNCFIDHLATITAILNSKKYKLILPLVVLNELDGLSKGGNNSQYESQDHATMVQQEATKAVAYLEEQFEQRNPHIRALTSKGTTIDTVAFRSEETDKTGNNDDLILSCCLHYCQDKARDFMPRPDTGKRVQLQRDVVLLTDDRNLRLKAHTRNVPVRHIMSFSRWAKLS
ncbi:unnamed protein product, partial [Owenia fusiformis]